MSQQMWTVERYLEFERASEERHEYRDGFVYRIPHSNSNHSIIWVNALASIHLQMRHRDGFALPCSMRLKVSATGLYTYADGTVTLEPLRLEDNYKDTLLNPTLIIEVLSPSTETYDRGKKFQHYRTIDSLKEYVLIAQDQPHIERYLRQPNGQWLYEDSIGLDASIELASIGCILALADVYNKINFEESETGPVQD